MTSIICRCIHICVGLFWAFPLLARKSAVTLSVQLLALSGAKTPKTAWLSVRLAGPPVRHLLEQIEDPERIRASIRREVAELSDNYPTVLSMWLICWMQRRRPYATMPLKERCEDLKRCLAGSGGWDLAMCGLLNWGFAPACLYDMNAVQHDLTKQSSHVEMSKLEKN